MADEILCYDFGGTALRVGVADGVMRDSIAKAYGVDVKKVERAFDIIGDFGEVAKRAKKKRLEKILKKRKIFRTLNFTTPSPRKSV